MKNNRQNYRFYLTFPTSKWTFFKFEEKREKKDLFILFTFFLTGIFFLALFALSIPYLKERNIPHIVRVKSNLWHDWPWMGSVSVVCKSGSRFHP